MATDTFIIAQNAAGIVSTVKNRILKNALVYQQDIADKADKIRRISFDVVFSVGVEMGKNITNNPTMSGVMLNDHSYKLPNILKCQVGTSNTLGITGKIIGAVSAGISGTTSPLGLYAAGFMPSDVLIESLQMAMEQNAILQLLVGNKLYKDLFITNIEYTYKKETYHAMLPTITLQQMQWVNVVTVGTAKSQAQVSKTDPSLLTAFSDFLGII